MISRLELAMLMKRPLRLRYFACGHIKRPSNAIVIRKGGDLYIRCRECKLAASRSYRERKGRK